MEVSIVVMLIKEFLVFWVLFLMVIYLKFNIATINENNHFLNSKIPFKSYRGEYTINNEILTIILLTPHKPTTTWREFYFLKNTFPSLHLIKKQLKHKNSPDKSTRRVKWYKKLK